MKSVVAGIMSRKNNANETEYLLVSSMTSFGEWTGLYYPPGGHVEEGEGESEALQREIKEELNLDVLVQEKLAETPADVEGEVVHWYACEIVGGKMLLDVEEVATADWYTQKDMETLKLWPATKHFFVEYIFKKNS